MCSTTYFALEASDVLKTAPAQSEPTTLVSWTKTHVGFKYIPQVCSELPRGRVSMEEIITAELEVNGHVTLQKKLCSV